MLKNGRRILSILLAVLTLISSLGLSGIVSAFAAEDNVTCNSVDVVNSADNDNFLWDNATVYTLLTDRFNNGNTANDHSYNRGLNQDGSKASFDMVAAFQGGDFKGITQKIEEGYFDSLGINVINVAGWIEQSHGYTVGGDGKASFAHYAYHGEHALDFTELDKNFGNEAEFKEMIDAAHSHGIRVVMSVEMNHPGYNNIYDMAEYGYGTLNSGWESTYYNWNAINQTNYHGTINYNGLAADWAKWWGADWVRAGMPGYDNNGSGDLTGSITYLPDFKTESTATVGIPQILQTKWSREGTLAEKTAEIDNTFATYNLGNKIVTNYLVAWYAKWVEEYGIDGFSCSNAKHVDMSSWKKLNDTCTKALQNWRAANPTAAGADWDEEFWSVGVHWGQGVEKNSYYSNGFDSMINFSFSGSNQGVGCDGMKLVTNISNTYATYANTLNSDDNFNVLTYISSMYTGLCRNDLYYQGSAFLLMPGGVNVYYGDETNRPYIDCTIHDHEMRRFMNWESMDKSVFAHWQKVGSFRNDHVAVGAGSHKALSATSGTAFARTYSKNGINDTVACVFGANKNASTTVSLGGIFSDGTVVVNTYTGEEATVSGGTVIFNSGAQGTILIEEALAAENGLVFEILNDSEIAVTGYNGGEEYVAIPDTVEGLPVTTIAGGAFSGSYTRRVYIPASVNTIEDNAFASCTALHIFYPGTSLQWKSSITIGTGNDAIYSGTRHYNVTDSNVYTSVVTAPTCTSQGYTTYTCTLCSDSFIADYTSKVSHDIKETVVKSTCMAQGYTLYSCENCSYSYKDAYTDIVSHSLVNGACEYCGEMFDIVESEHNYADNTDYTWTIERPSATFITLEFSADTEVEQNYDRIYIYDGNDNLVGSYTGTQLASQSITVDGDTAKIRLVSDDSSNCYGFKATIIYDESEEPTEPTETTIDETEPTTKVSSVDYNKVYFYDTLGWGDIYAHGWENYTGASSLGSWPGVACTYEGNDIWSLDVSYYGSPDNIIFNNGGNGYQTADLVFAGKGMICVPTGFTSSGSFGNTVYEAEWYDASNYLPEENTEATVTTVTTVAETTTSAVSDGTITIYFDNSIYGWSNVYWHAWNLYGGISTPWPGDAMEYIGNNIYKAEVDAAYDYIIFNCNTEQTSDLEIVGDNMIYSNGSWSSFNEEDNTEVTVATATTVAANDPVETTAPDHGIELPDQEFTDPTEPDTTVAPETTVPETEPAVKYYSVVFVDYNGKLISGQVVAEGKGAVAPTEPARNGYTFTGWDKEFDNVTSDLTVTAQYKRNSIPVSTATSGPLKVEVAGGSGFKISINGGNARPQGASYVNSKLAIGSTVTLTVLDSGNSKFMGWINPNTGAIVSASETYTFVSSGNDYIKAMYQTEIEGVNLVVFKNDRAAGGNGQILDMQYYMYGDEIITPDAPTLAGYDFAGWSITDEEIQVELSKGNDVTVLANWTRAIKFVTITVEGGTFGSEQSGQHPAYASATVVADSPADGMKFAYWTNAEGKVVSYDAEYKFYPAADTYLKANFVAENTEIEYQAIASLAADPTTQGEKITYSMSWDVPESVGEFSLAGLMVVDAEDYNADTFYHGSGDSKIFDRALSGSMLIPKNTYGIAKGASYYGHTYYACTWVQYVDANGETVTVYSDIVEVEKYAE